MKVSGKVLFMSAFLGKYYTVLVGAYMLNKRARARLLMTYNSRMIWNRKKAADRT